MQLYIYRVPDGVTLGICAYNYPLALIGWKLGPALVVSNVMIIKPHESKPITASEFCCLVEQAALPIRGQMVCQRICGLATLRYS